MVAVKNKIRLQLINNIEELTNLKNDLLEHPEIYTTITVGDNIVSISTKHLIELVGRELIDEKYKLDRL